MVDLSQRELLAITKDERDWLAREHPDIKVSDKPNTYTDLIVCEPRTGKWSIEPLYVVNVLDDVEDALRDLLDNRTFSTGLYSCADSEAEITCDCDREGCDIHYSSPEEWVEHLKHNATNLWNDIERHTEAILQGDYHQPQTLLERIEIAYRAVDKHYDMMATERPLSDMFAGLHLLRLLNGLKVSQLEQAMSPAHLRRYGEIIRLQGLKFNARSKAFRRSSER
ncbi:hypothetical protein SAMN04488498_101395 [Mesorhizobium albiziae]|uniref:Uncharacterized protein n=1 Tax=Neomesorhizobium albiziae TaxID=335020 RepID=A0A1I3VF36_9HYPH|nr:hypothetical protein [Mesorhizobium albiziae]GLS28853.1 hypothetical protein GCM10007937_05600 [Mesorhizobium albiziae]SFJ93619.1 hypothetical protein SAMN04488498_101395 [Mesorhizobium albiziae]